MKISKAKKSERKSTCVLFCGSNAAGKLLAAQVLAHELNLDLHTVDLSKALRKYIGETEKNLDKIFQDAEESNAVLFFDEADALFGKRTEVKDAHNRYANAELTYLLNRIEKHSGLTIIVATSPRNIKDASPIKQINFTVDFPPPHKKPP
ncbi:MAG: ATP-binding protein [Candidatus Bathyarchaeota archaeon]|nr:ATP-binding protein [Candidatus Bathyarchaeota archaeon]